MATHGVASHLAAQGARGPPQVLRDGSEGMAAGQAQTHRLTFFRRQVSVRFRVHGNTLAHLG